MTTNITYSLKDIREKMQVVVRSDGSTVSYFADHTGSIHSTVYTPFRGISLVHKDVHIPQFVSNWRYEPDNVFVIEHCREGRLECQVGDDCLYIAPGDIVIFRTDPNVRELRYPNSHYHATALVIHLDEASEILSDHLNRAGFTIEFLQEKYLPDGRYYNVLKSNSLLAQVFDNIYTAPQSVLQTYYGLKTLESLLLLASDVPVIDECPPNKVAKTQADMVKQVHSYVMSHPAERYTINDLAKEFSISPTQLKNYFQVIYGMPIQKFMREQKMKAAAKLLETTGMKVAEVASHFGYSNMSKFAAAFESVIGESPKQYSLKFYISPNQTPEK